MSYDLMVFKPESAPKNKADFMDWFSSQTQWKETHGYNNPANTSPELRNWFMEIINSFPAMNGPFANNEDEDDDKIADYTIGNDIIYITFAWSVTELAYKLTKSLAEKHNVGFFDVSASDGDIIFPSQT